MPVAMGRSSVKPSTRIGSSLSRTTAAISCMIGRASALAVASPLANSRLDFSSISSHSSLPCTEIRSRATRSANCSSTRREMRRNSSGSCGSEMVAFGSSSSMRPEPGSCCGDSMASGTLPGFTAVTGSPTWIGLMLRSGMLKASLSVCDSTRNLSSLRCDTAYITTKKASSSVRKSA